MGCAFLSDPSTIELDIKISPGLITLSNRKIDIPIGIALLDIWLFILCDFFL